MDRIILEAGKTTPASGGSLAYRTVLCYLPENVYTPFVVWCECFRENGTSYFVQGDYAKNIKTAVEYFERRK